jgi:hypothetical protein
VGVLRPFVVHCADRQKVGKWGGEGFALGRERGFQTIFLITPKKLSAVVERLE